ncbi:MAG: hypothetical protein CFH01_01336 [Alphaproteobacteria bacterium MarineAlpha2_Bin1]|nr:MAG: hypothetical protein CFH01_01336 [Alphaproteobacteria bacterium MarineAlpha2_Bin1]|tara:strand:- start:859 stop:1149 length:291 start_codon:yes stop_codon:yes gene_type:complete
MKAKIFQPAKTAMQSAPKLKNWRLQFELKSAKKIEPLMGWTSSSDTNQQICLSFSSKEEAVSYAEKNKISYVILEPKKRNISPKSYSANFSYEKVN